ncbi:UNVERIFIED_CONTAM: hypothetical protein FKN15_014280 [Acipenser sinensis]
MHFDFDGKHKNTISKCRIQNPQRALCVRGPLANNGKRNHREYQLSGKTSSRAVALAAAIAEEKTQNSQLCKGLGGKGNIFIWVSGNGGLANDHCGADGYVNCIYTVAIGAVTNLGLSTFNSEACSALMAVVHVSSSRALLGNISMKLQSSLVRPFIQSSLVRPFIFHAQTEERRTI